MATLEELEWRLGQLEKWRGQIEDLKPDVMDDRLKNLVGEVRGLKVAFWSLTIAILTSAVGIVVTMVATYRSHG